MSSIRAKSKNFASDVLSKGFKPEKCKTALKLAVARMKLLRNKREAQVKHMRRDLAQLLASGQEQSARIRVEHVIREEKTMAAYDLIELYCELIIARLPIIGSQKNCPIDLKEAIASVMFASPRCADVPELMDIRKHFTAKYGKEFINSALEVRPDCGVSRMIVEKLSARAPDVETKNKILTAIAQEHNVQWDPKAFEELQKPKEDLLDGPNTFVSSNTFSKEASDVKLTSEPSQKNEATNKKFEEDVSRPISSNASHRNTNTPIISESEIEVQEDTPENREVKYSYSRGDDDSLNHSNWNLEFKDATSAAQAAAESAERASMAARAAAELASRGNASGHYPTSSCAAPIFPRDQGPVKSMSSKPNVEPVIEEAVSQHNEAKHPQVVKQGGNILHRDELMMRAGSHGAPESTIDACEDVRSRSSTRSPSVSSEASSHDDISEFNLQKADEMAYGHTQSLPTVDHIEQKNTSKKYENDEFDQRTTSENYSKSSSFYSKTKFDEDTIWDANFEQLEDAEGQDSAIGAARIDSAKSQKEPSFGLNSAVVFDDYISDTDDHLTYGKSNEGDLSFSNDNLPVTFDDSDGLDSQSENELDKEAVESDSLVHTQRSFSRGPLAAESDHTLTSTSLRGEMEVEQAKEGSSSRVFSNTRSGKTSGSRGSSDNQLSPRKETIFSISSSSDRGLLYHSEDEEPQSPGASKVSSMKEHKQQTEVKFDSTSSSKDSEQLDVSSYGNGQALNLGRLTGGLRNRGFPRPRSVRSPLVNASFSSKQSLDGAPSISENPSVSLLDKSSVNAKTLDEEKYDEESAPRSYLSSQRTSRAYLDSTFDEAEGLESQRSSNSIWYSDGASFSANNATEDAPGITKNLSLQIEDSSSQRSRRKDRTAYKSEASKLYSDSESNKQNSHAGGSESYEYTDSISPIQSTDSSSSTEKASVTDQSRMSAASEVPHQILYDKMPRAKAYNELNSKMQASNIYHENDEEEDLESSHLIRSRGTRDVKLSRRTRGLRSETRKDDRSELPDQTTVPSISELESKPSYTSSSVHKPLSKTSQAIKLEGKERSKPLQSNSPNEQPSVTPSMTENPKSSQVESKLSLTTKTGNPETSSLSGGSTSPGNSSKDASHVHPKLPRDFEAFAARLLSLQTNKRT